MFVVARTRVQMGVRHAQISSNVGADPVGNILLVHWVLVSLVSAWTRHISCCSLVVRFDTVVELGNFAALVLHLIVRVLKVKIT